MVQTLRSQMMSSGHQMILIEKPHALTRIFFRVGVLGDQTMGRQMRISFDDPMFRSYYILDGQAKFFEARGEGIFQGDVWARNTSTGMIVWVATEILV